MVITSGSIIVANVHHLIGFSLCSWLVRQRITSLAKFGFHLRNFNFKYAVFCATSTCSHPIKLPVSVLMSGNPLLLPARHTARPNRFMQNQRASTMVWASQSDISSEFDVPYSPIVDQSDTQKPPHPGGLGRRLVRALLPAALVALLSVHSIKSRPRSLWDRVVFVWFCGCLFLLSYMLAGFGYPGHDDANCTMITGTPSYTITNYISVNRTSFAGLLQGALAKGLKGDKLNWREGDAIAEPIVSKSLPTVMPLGHSHNQRETQAPMARFPPLHLAGRKDPFDLEPFFDGGGYGDDGQTFALKIHILQDATSSGAVYHGGNSRRCRGSGRC
jgi:hypothetical protein